MKHQNNQKPKGLTATRQKRLERAGWRLGSTGEFLGLSDEEVAFVELKLTLSESLRKCGTSQGLSQSELAKRLRSSQSRVAKMEASDPAVSVDLLIRALFAAGAKKEDIAKAITKSESLAA
jgi:ribosome-binding protein aMBF1 (putative translation factor)